MPYTQCILTLACKYSFAITEKATEMPKKAVAPRKDIRAVLVKQTYAVHSSVA